MTKSQHLQIRVSPQEKARLKRLAKRAGQEVSTYVLSRLLSSGADRFAVLLRALRRGGDHPFVLAELNDLLADVPSASFADVVGRADVEGLSPWLANYVAAMVEHVAVEKAVDPPRWVHEVPPLEEPYFGAELQSLRWYLLHVAPVAFKRRNIFVDATVGDRV